MNKKDHFDTEEFMSVPEVARYLGVGRKMVYQLLDTGELAFARERGAIRILAESVDYYRDRGHMI